MMEAGKGGSYQPVIAGTAQQLQLLVNSNCTQPSDRPSLKSLLPRSKEWLKIHQSEKPDFQLCS